MFTMSENNNLLWLERGLPIFVGPTLCILQLQYMVTTPLFVVHVIVLLPLCALITCSNDGPSCPGRFNSEKKKAPAPIEKWAQWDPQPVWTLWRKGTYPAIAESRTVPCPVRNLVTIPTELCRFISCEYKAIPLQVWTGRWGSRRLRLPRFLDNRHMEVIRLSALRTDGLYTTGNIPATHFSHRLSRPQDHSAAGRTISWQNSKESNPRPSGL
jgi:hypothetical protein